MAKYIPMIAIASAIGCMRVAESIVFSLTSLARAVLQFAANTDLSASATSLGNIATSEGSISSSACIACIRERNISLGGNTDVLAVVELDEVEVEVEDEDEDELELELEVGFDATEALTADVNVCLIEACSSFSFLPRFLILALTSSWSSAC